MDSAVLSVSPTTDGRFWDGLRTRVDAILDDRAKGQCGAVSERPKRLREDSLMLVRGLDSVAASLAQLSDTLTAAQKGVNDLATCPSRVRERETDDEVEEPDAKRQCGGGASTETARFDLPAGADGEGSGFQGLPGTKGDIIQASAEVAKSTNLKMARNLAVSMAGRAATLARELKNIKSELHFMQERCGLLEEENKRLRDGYDNGAALEEDDLVRLQLEALLAEKSQLAQDNANLERENQSLIQLVEYHQLTSQDLAASYEDVMEGTRLDFSSPLGKIGSDADEEGELDDGVLPATPGILQVRLQLEALLAEKSRLAQDNANLERENQSLIQLVEYHQLTSQDLAASYEDVMEGTRLDFSSSLGKIGSDADEEGEVDDGVLQATPGNNKLEPSRE